jgi:serine/threonine protein kinase
LINGNKVKICDFGSSRGTSTTKVNKRLTFWVQTQWYRAPGKDFLKVKNKRTSKKDFN